MAISDSMKMAVLSIGHLQAPERGYFVDGFHQLAGTFQGTTRKFEVARTIIFHSAKLYNPMTKSFLWECPTGKMVDGASIPRALWTVVGAPYSGKYRVSSAVHDVYCPSGWANITGKDADLLDRQAHQRIPYKRVHALFAEMIAVEGVTGWKQWAMAQGVKRGGPRW